MALALFILMKRFADVGDGSRSRRHGKAAEATLPVPSGSRPTDPSSR
jgi:hypothetical protein